MRVAPIFNSKNLVNHPKVCYNECKKGGKDMNFHIYNVICAIFALYIYITFRFGVNSYLRVNKNSKTFIRKNKKGFANYWIYKKIHEEINLGYIYYLNLLLLVLTAMYSIVAISFGWAGLMRIPIAILNLILCCVQVPSMIFSNIYDNYECYGQPFIVLRKNRAGRGFESSIFNIGCIIAMVAFSIYNFTLALQ